MKKKRPEKLTNVLEKIKECITQEKYVFSKHAFDRVVEREIDIPTVIHILLTGYLEKNKDEFDEVHRSWKYAIGGKTKEEKTVRVIISFDEYGMVVITVMYVT